jgi:Holliday junction resolvasome RuvABC endonuclease subunit
MSLIRRARYCSHSLQRFYSTKLFLGLDIASRTTGFTILDAHGTPIHSGIIDTSKAESIQQYGAYMKEQFFNLTQQYNNATWVVGVEDFMMGYRLSNAQTLFKLCACNTLASYEVSNVFKTEPMRLNVSQARSFLKLKKDEQNTAKEIVFNHLKHLLPSSYQMKYSSRQKDKILPCNYDVTDSLLIALYTAVLYRIQEKLNCQTTLGMFLPKLQDHKKIKTIKKKLGIGQDVLVQQLMEHEQVKKEIVTLYEKELFDLEYQNMSKLLKV